MAIDLGGSGDYFVSIRAPRVRGDAVILHSLPSHGKSRQFREPTKNHNFVSTVHGFMMSKNWYSQENQAPRTLLGLPHNFRFAFTKF